MAVLPLVAATALRAQNFPQKGEDGKVIYYKILTASDDFARRCLCLQDVSNLAGEEFQYTLHEYDETERRQEWSLIAADAASETYYLRNRMTYRYLSVDTGWMNGLLVPVYSRSTGGNELSIASIPNGDSRQVTISCDGVTGRNYFTATDVSKGVPVKPQSLVGSAWAWYIVPAAELSTGMDSIAEGTMEQTECYDLSGRMVTEAGNARHGVYLTRKNGVFRKVLR